MEKMLKIGATIWIGTMKKNSVYVDSEFRFFLLDLLMHTQDFTFFDIKCSVQRDSGKEISDRRLRDILKTMVGNKLLKKNRLERRDDFGSLFSYHISKKGLQKWNYYKKKLNH